MSEESDALLHIADDHPCCKPTLLWAHNHLLELERENAALRAELAPLRETVGVAATASTCADDLSNWSKLVERADNSTRLERENAALLDLIQDMAYQHCHTGVAIRDYNGQVAGTMVTDSGALSVNGQALRLLAQTKPPRFRVVAEFGRMVVGYWPENDPQKEAQP